MLWSAGLELPHQVFAHGFFTNKGEKISKSLGNAIEPIGLVQKYGNDALRYFLLREITFGADGDFSLQRFSDVYHSDLANNLGNLVSRLATMLNKYNNSAYQLVDVPNNFEIDDDIQALAFHSALATLFARLDALNGAIEENKPWELFKADPDKTIEVLNSIVSELLLVNTYLEPFLPETTAKIKKVFNAGKVDSSAGILFPKFED
jgi:methionyl-tRNA synthetase